MSPSSCLVITFGARVIELTSLVFTWRTFLREVHVGELLQDLFFRKTVRGAGLPDADTPLNFLSFLFVEFVLFLYRLRFGNADCLLTFPITFSFDQEDGLLVSTKFVFVH